MINILIDKLPERVTIGGLEYEINSNYSNSLLFEILISDKSLDENEKIEKALELYYPIIPNDINEAVEKLLWFYRCGKDIKKSKGKGNNIKKQIYSYEQDDSLIFAAFLHDYRIDLTQTEYLHWWSFKALFNGLHRDNELCEIMKYRATDLSKIKDKEEKAYYKKMQELYKIEEEATQEELDELEKWNNLLK